MIMYKNVLRSFRKLYNLIPFKKHVFVLIKRIHPLPQSIYKYLFFKGNFNVIVDENSSFKMRHYGHGFDIENDTFWAGINGGWEKESVALWIKLCKDPQIVLDIGANTGIYALLAKALNPDSYVFALEPVKRVFEKLVDNNKLNNYNIVCLPFAASNYNGKAVIYDPSGENVYSVTVNKNLNTKHKTQIVEIQTITTDTIIEKYHLPYISLLKIDVETHEPEVLEGFSKYLKLYSPSILIEVLKDEIGERIENILNKLGCNYLYFNIDELGGVRRVKRILKSDYYNYLLCTEEVAKKLDLM